MFTRKRLAYVASTTLWKHQAIYKASVVCIGVAIATAGCRPQRLKPANLPTLIPVRVTVLQQSKPVTGAFVRLLPADASVPWNCGATTGDNGVAIIKTLGEFDGAPEGDYKVLITKIETPRTAGADLSNATPRKEPVESDSFHVIDPKYGAPNETTLEMKVAEGHSVASFDVGDPVRVPVERPR